MELVAQMLVETNLSISNIAQQLGYADVAKLSRAFLRETAMSPLAYRQRYGIR
jgi:AraC-like DNA-binding protein